MEIMDSSTLPHPGIKKEHNYIYDKLDNLFFAQDVLFLVNKTNIYCSCGFKVSGLRRLEEHLESHGSVCEIGDAMTETDQKQLKDLFNGKFIFKPDNSTADHSVVSVTLPHHLFCICLGEADIGVFSSQVSCYLCHKSLANLDKLNQHVEKTHKITNVIIGENITFEKPNMSNLKDNKQPAFFCPMPKCKYNIMESHQTKHFSTFKLLKQHFTKVHGQKSVKCDGCNAEFAAGMYLKQHEKSCGKVFACNCGATYSHFESLQTHARRKGHQIDPKYLKVPAVKEVNTAEAKLNIIQRYGSDSGAGCVPIAPKPSAMHLNAAIALSELAAANQFTPKADVGIQTDIDIHDRRCRKSQSPFVSEDVLHRASPVKLGKRKISAETQTKVGSKRRCPTVSSEVQTMGEYVVKFGKRQLDNLASQGIQCRISPVKKVASSTSTATCTGYEDLLTVDIPGAEDILKSLRPLHRNTNGTQTSPRVKSILTSRLSIESLDEDVEDISEVLSMPSLEHIQAPDPLMSTTMTESSSRAPNLGEIRQFSTETQTDLDVFLNQGDNWTSVDGTEAAMDDFGEDIDFLTSNMETQTSSDLLLYANIYTQTGPEHLLPLALTADVPGQHQVPPDYTCSAETQTSLTGFQSVLDQPVMVTDQGIMNHIETQTINEFCSTALEPEQIKSHEGIPDDNSSMF